MVSGPAIPELDGRFHMNKARNKNGPVWSNEEIALNYRPSVSTATHRQIHLMTALQAPDELRLLRYAGRECWPEAPMSHIRSYM